MVSLRGLLEKKDAHESDLAARGTLEMGKGDRIRFGKEFRWPVNQVFRTK